MKNKRTSTNGTLKTAGLKTWGIPAFPESIIKRVRLRAAADDCRMKDIVIRALESYLGGSHSDQATPQ